VYEVETWVKMSRLCALAGPKPLAFALVNEIVAGWRVRARYRLREDEI
jgi:hypothetical protein